LNEKPTKLDRLLSAYPIVAAYLGLLVLYAWQTTRIPSPWIFTDELNWSLLSRAIAHTGHPALRGQPAPARSLYAYFLAPAWWAGATTHAYATAKYLNAIVMTASIFPAYGLGRLFLPRPHSFVVAVAAAAIPSLALTGVLMPESLAYFWSTAAVYAGARALLRPTKRSVALAVALVVISPFVRDQLRVLVLAAVTAVIVFAAVSPSGRAIIRSWTRGERFRAAVLALGLVIAADVLLIHHSFEWEIGTHFWHHAFTYGVWATGAFAIGVGVLPVVLALAWLLEGHVASRPDRVLLAVLASVAFWFALYTAVKASYIATTFAIRVEERNLIYLSPIVFVAAARYVTARRVRVVPLAVSAAAVGWLLWATPYHAYEHLYSDAFGLSILQWLNQTWYWTISDLRWLLYGILAASVVFALALRFSRWAVVAAAVLGALVVGWNLTGEISAADQAVAPAKFQRSLIPTPPDWIDQTNGRARSFFIGKSLQGSDSFWTTEFWNQSIGEVWSVDASTPPPGPTRTPNFLGTGGAVDPQLPVDWVVAQPDLGIRGTVAQRAGGLVLYHVPHPIRMTGFVSGITPDGWMELGAPSRYVRFATHPVKGTLTISASRSSAAACGNLAPSRFTFRVYRLRIDKNGQPAPGRPETTARTVVRSTPCENKQLSVPAVAPLLVVGSAQGAFTAGDGRKLTAQVGYGFTARATARGAS
jgi:hypothetical protein